MNTNKHFTLFILSNNQPVDCYIFGEFNLFDNKFFCQLTFDRDKNEVDKTNKHHSMPPKLECQKGENDVKNR